MRLRIVVVALLVVTGGCRYLLGLHDLPGADASVDAYLPDAGPCQELGVSCAGPDTLRTCTVLGEQPTDTACSWSCSTTPDVHCTKMVPSGGGLTAADLEMSGLTPIAITTNATVDDLGSITGIRGLGPGIVNGINFHLTNNVAVYNFDSLTIGPAITLTMQGTHPIAFAVRGDLEIDSATLDATGGCNNNQTGGPGGGVGGNPGQPGGGGIAGGGGGTQIGGESSGGGGGSYGASGGTGGKSATTMAPAAGALVGDAEITKLVGGGGGGGGGGPTGGAGGGGGGGFQLAANGTITISGSINAGGCGARHGGLGSNGGGGGGAGAGGTILIEAHDLTLAAVLAVNGGGGAAGAGGQNGSDASVNGTRAAGGLAGAGGAGGLGGATTILVGDPGHDDNQGAGGAGGGVGRIRLNTRTGTVMMMPGATLSPTLTDTGTTSTTGQAATQ